MKKVAALLIITIALIVTSCKSGCGCPGNAGYPSDNMESVQTTESLHA